MPDNAPQPAAETARLAQLGQLLVDDDEGFVDHVTAQIWVAEKPGGHAVGGVLVAAHQLCEGTPVALAGPSYQLRCVLDCSVNHRLVEPGRGGIRTRDLPLVRMILPLIYPSVLSASVPPDTLVSAMKLPQTNAVPAPCCGQAPV